MRLLVGVRSPGGPDNPSAGHATYPAAGWGRPLADDVEAMLHARRLRVDEDPWWHPDDVRDYAASVLRNPPGSRYALAEHQDTTVGVAQVLADRAIQSFLVARIAAASLADRPYLILPSDPAWPAAVDDGVLGVFRDDLNRSFSSRHDRERAVVLLRAVAFAFGRGLPWGEIWPLVANAVADTYAKNGDRDIAWPRASPMSAYLVPTGKTTPLSTVCSTIRCASLSANAGMISLRTAHHRRKHGSHCDDHLEVSVHPSTRRSMPSCTWTGGN